MRIILTYFFVTLGVIFFAIILFLVYAWHANVWGVQNFVSFVQSEPLPMEPAGESGGSGASTEQQSALEEYGLDESTFTNLSDEQEACFTENLGEDRVAEILDGAMPTLTEITTGAECL